jgi:uncharacterized protein with HEPN domain
MAADPRVCLHDILNAVAGVREAIGDADFASYRERRPMKRAVEREIEIISEASRRIPRKLKAEEPGIPWHEIAGIGNVLRHDYKIVSDPVVWNVVQEHLPALDAAVRRILERLDTNDR